MKAERHTTGPPEWSPCIVPVNIFINRFADVLNVCYANNHIKLSLPFRVLYKIFRNRYMLEHIHPYIIFFSFIELYENCLKQHNKFSGIHDITIALSPGLQIFISASRNHKTHVNSDIFTFSKQCKIYFIVNFLHKCCLGCSFCVM